MLGFVHQPGKPLLLCIHVLLVQCPMRADLSYHERIRIEMSAVSRIRGRKMDKLAADVHHSSRGDASDARVMRSCSMSVYKVEEVVCLLVRIQSNSFILVRRDWHFPLAAVLFIPFAVGKIKRWFCLS